MAGQADERTAVRRVPNPSTRTARLEHFAWWSTETAHRARIGVVGVGAIGNEVLKLLALLDFRFVRIFDRDVVEISNLSRSVLLNEDDAGEPKVLAAEQALLRMNPRLQVEAYHADVTCEVGLGNFRDLDLVIAGLDGRSVRVWVNQHVRSLGVPWIDGATGGQDGLQGTAMTFLPVDGPCYECTMTSNDWALVDQLDRCGSRDRERIYSGTVPTTPMASSVVAAAQVQQALALLNNQTRVSTQGFEFDLSLSLAFPSVYPRLQECSSHQSIESLIISSRLTTSSSLAELLDLAEPQVGAPAALTTRWLVVTEAKCEQCSYVRSIRRPTQLVSEADLTCTCGSRMTEIEESEFYRDESGAMPLSALTVPSRDIVQVVGRLGTCYVELSHGAPDPLQPEQEVR